jgi:hypothetical protein
MVDYAEALRIAHGISKALERLAIIAPTFIESEPDTCPLRIRHYTLSGALTGFPGEGWDCPFCGEFFTPECATCAGDDW